MHKKIIVLSQKVAKTILSLKIQNNEKKKKNKISHLSNRIKACQFFVSAGAVAFLCGERVPLKWLSDGILRQPLKIVYQVAEYHPHRLAVVRASSAVIKTVWNNSPPPTNDDRPATVSPVHRTIPRVSKQDSFKYIKKARVHSQKKKKKIYLSLTCLT